MDESSEMTNKQIAERYHEHAVKLAKIIGELELMHDSCKILNDETCDEGDPMFLLNDVITEAGKALAAIVVYADEYGKENGDGQNA